MSRRFQKTDWAAIELSKKEALRNGLERARAQMNEEARQRADKIEADLKTWRGWKGFLRDGGVPGCRIPEHATTREIAELLATVGIDGYDGSVGPDNMTWPIYDVATMREADDSYNPDY